MQWVLAYADLGWPVLPLHANTERPATANGLHDATTDSGITCLMRQQSGI